MFENFAFAISIDRALPQAYFLQSVQPSQLSFGIVTLLMLAGVLMPAVMVLSAPGCAFEDAFAALRTFFFFFFFFLGSCAVLS